MKIQTIPVTAFAQNCSLIWDDDTLRGALVDPGGDLDLIDNEVKKNNVTIEKILLTHGHLDHVGAAVAASKKYQASIVGPHIADKFWFDALMQQSQMFGFPPASPFLPQEWLEDGDTVSVGNLMLSVRHCPGHTPGHIAYIESHSSTAIVGDILFKGGVGRTDFPQGDKEQLITSIKNKLYTLPDETQVYPGHGPTTTIAEERSSNPFTR